MFWHTARSKRVRIIELRFQSPSMSVCFLLVNRGLVLTFVDAVWFHIMVALALAVGVSMVTQSLERSLL
jgi:hypothetical protein